MADYYRNASLVTPSDTANLPGALKAFSVGTTGTVTVDTVGGTIGAVIYAVAGFIYNLEVTKVYNTGTSASDINGYW